MSFKRFLIAIAVLLTFAAPSAAIEVSGGASVDYTDNYVWRGVQLTDDEGAVQPSVSASYMGLGVNYWASYDLDTSENNETDYTVSYGYTYKMVSLETGYIYYDLDVTGGDTHEVYGSVSVDVISSPSLTYYHDIDLGDGGFLVASIGHSQEIPVPLFEGLAINVGASASVNFENAVMQIDGDGDGFTDDFTDFYNGEISTSISIPIPGLEGAVIEPRVAYSFPMSSDAEKAIEGLSVDPNPHGGGEIVYGGVGFSVSF